MGSCIDIAGIFTAWSGVFVCAGYTLRVQGPRFDGHIVLHLAYPSRNKCSCSYFYGIEAPIAIATTEKLMEPTEDEIVDEICGKLVEAMEGCSPGPTVAAMAMIVGKICAASSVEPQIVYTLIEEAYEASLKEIGGSSSEGNLN